MYSSKKSITGVLIIISGLLFLSCTGSADSDTIDSNKVDVIMNDYAFAVVDSISSGWTTFRMDNRGQETHEFIMHRLPEDKSYQDMHTEVVQPLDSLQQLLLEGTIDSSEHEKAIPKALPDWIGKLESIGGGGLISPGEVSRITLKLDSGNYAMSCFILSPNGRRHVFQGMIRSITVAGNSSENAKPQPDVTVTSFRDSISVDGSLFLGTNTIAFHVVEPDSEDTNPYSSMYLAYPLGPMQSVNEFRDFDTHDPPSDLIGGALGVPEGDTSFVTVELTSPGTYNIVFPHGEKNTIIKEITID